MARILVVDDENNVRMMIRMALQHIGHDVETASDGYDALGKFGNGGDWSLILLDQRMPGMDGLSVLKEMRKKAPKTRVVMATAFGTVDLVMSAREVGATDFLRKPFTIETLRASIQIALEGEPPNGAESEALPLAFSSVNVNGYRIEYRPDSNLAAQDGTHYLFNVSTFESEPQTCAVFLPGYMVETVNIHASREQFPGDSRFWQALCEEVLSNYLWQHAELPPQGALRIEELTSGLRRWIGSVLDWEKREGE
jgi:DNA-binding response OmpR family regulator